MSMRAFIAGCSGLALTEEEVAFFRESRPWGFILFRRNIGTPEQVLALTDALRDCVGRADAPVLVDQEGGRVQRLGPPHWPKYPAGRAFAALRVNDPLHLRETVRLSAMLMARDLLAVGITVDCLPVLDVPVAGAHDVIGDRAYGADPSSVAVLGRAAAEGLMAAGVLPVMKHVPGHGRAGVDSHLHLPVVTATRRRLEQERQRVDHVLTQRREALAERRMSEHSLKLRADNLAQAIAEAGLELDAVIAGLPAHADIGDWAQALTELEGKIRRLEPVNLAAIQEYEEQSQRKTYLDAQLTDLSTAMETLEGAIKKIDRETRQRFKETFDKVNSGLQELFPRLFGGGHAYLELTGDDLLDTGVSIMARPPGKRVTSISLLSGGEKALTAVALVFSIFRLNPAPFCLLDEVDAPLDEANVGRLAAMVKEMSEKVQFLFVTHNKATMEAARQLSGVTMREPGVSRLVSVDLAEATRLAGAA